MLLHRLTKGTKTYRLWDPEKKSTFVSRDVVFDEDSMLQAKSKMEDKAQGGASDNSVDFEIDEFELSDDPIKHVGSDEDSSVSDRVTQKATQGQQVQPRLLKRSNRVRYHQSDMAEKRTKFFLH